MNTLKTCSYRKGKAHTKELKVQLTEIVNDVLAEAHLKKGDLFVLGCSTSEVVGGHIGKNSSAEVGQWIIRTLKELLGNAGITETISNFFASATVRSTTNARFRCSQPWTANAISLGSNSKLR